MVDAPPVLQPTDARGRARSVDRAIAELAERQHGVVARRQLLVFARTGNITARIQRGALHPIHRGVYAVGHAVIGIEGRWMAATLAVGPGAVLSHRSAGHLWGLMSAGRIAPEVTIPRGWRGQAGVCVRHSALPEDEIDEVDGIPVTGVARTLLDLGPLLNRHGIERAMNQAEVLGLTGRVSVPDLLARYPRRPGSAVLRGLLGEEETERGITRDELERRFAALVDAHGLTRPRFNADLAVRGRFFVVDCLWPDARLIVELDGRAVHGTRLAFERDRERDRLLVLDGWCVVRFTWRQLREEARTVAADLRRLLQDGAASTL